jgi:nucleotide-binding universal stress UspA family protein
MTKLLILCPIDYSDSTEPAIGIAAELAKANSAKIILLHVIEPDEKAISIDDSANQQFKERLRDRILDRNDIEFEHVTRHGDPADVIIDYAKKNSVDRIVMGSHGLSGLKSVFVGSFAKQVMSDATCPVVMVKLPLLAAVKS